MKASFFYQLDYFRSTIFDGVRFIVIYHILQKKFKIFRNPLSLELEFLFFLKSRAPY